MADNPTSSMILAANPDKAKLLSDFRAALIAENIISPVLARQRQENIDLQKKHQDELVALAKTP